jgi:hypothetical protein
MKLRIPSNKAVAVYPGGGLSVYVPGGGDVVEVFQSGIKWLLRDEFTTSLAAGSVNGTNAEPGPGVRTVVDTGNNLSISGGRIGPNGITGDGNPCIGFGSIARTSGKMVIGLFNSNSLDNNCFTLGNSSSSAGYATWAQGFYFGSESLQKYDLIGGFNIAPVVSLTDYKLAFALRTGGCFFLIKGGIYTNWTLIFSSGVNTTATLYPYYTQYAGSGRWTGDFIRIPQTLWLPTPLLSDGFGGTWPTTDGKGHAEGIAGGIGSGGGGLTWTDAGNASIAGGVLSIGPSLGVEKYTDPGLEATYTGGKCDTLTDLDGTPTLTESADSHSGTKAQQFLADAIGELVGMPSIALTIGKWYRQGVWAKRLAGTRGATYFIVTDGSGLIIPGYITSATYVELFATYRQIGANSIYSRIREGSSTTFDTVVFDDYSLKLLPISTLITNQSLITTDVLAEAVITAYPGTAAKQGTQAGVVQSDRSFAAKAAATAAAGQAVIALKNIGDQSATGLAITDTITIKHAGGDVTYTIASVAGGSNVAYNDTTKTQTITLGTNLSEEVAADSKVGLNWASWNGVMAYFGGDGNIKVDEVKAGVYTNRGSTAKAFSADARTIVRKIGTSYYWFYGEALIASSTAIDAAAQVGKYFGLFSTSANNTFGSAVIYDTGAVTGLYSNLDRYSS